MVYDFVIIHYLWIFFIMLYILINVISKASTTYTQNFHAFNPIVNQTLSKQNYFTALLAK